MFQSLTGNCRGGHMIQISLLGSVRVCGRDGRAAHLPTRRGIELFAFLVLEDGRRFERSLLVEHFWPHLPEERGRRALNTELWRLSHSLRSVGMDTDRALQRSPIGVGYVGQPGTVVDVDALRAAMRVIRAIDPAEASRPEIATVEAGVAAYRGDLLESVYSDWCLLWRENLRAQHTEALEFLLAAAMAHRDWTAGLRHGRALLALDPLMEHVHRAVMRCHFHNGDRPLAMRQYALCEQLLREELDVEPMDETRRIQETILALPGRPPKATAELGGLPRRRTDGTHTPAQKVDMALANVNSARHWLEDASRDLHGERPE
jgi:DNA-binding SARP family transcriptional activator